MYLDDENLADDYKMVLQDLEIIPKTKKNYVFSLSTEKLEPCFPEPTTNTQYITIIGQFLNVRLKIKLKSKEELLILGSTIGESFGKELLNIK